MRVRTAPDLDGAAELAEYSEILLQIDVGRFPVYHEGIFVSLRICAYFLKYTTHLLVVETVLLPRLRLNFPIVPYCKIMKGTTPAMIRNQKTTDVTNVYPGVGDENVPDQYCEDRVILTRTNASVRGINEMITEQHLSNDSLEDPGDESLFEPEFLNSLNFSDMRPHKKILKVRKPVIMSRNLNSEEALGEKGIGATLMTGPRRGKRVFIPRIVFFSDDEVK
ncbi:Helitron helicase [Phytophthora megakarya]|uniref:Helitron helicase n=1 Tax=Phytophthora megakarya TaxID=4795 RepID=A0A225X288_9STRA|nr:Helitron helicase [Phytophthora megakarya]